MFVFFLFVDMLKYYVLYFFFFQAEDGIRDKLVTGVQTCALPISRAGGRRWYRRHAANTRSESQDGRTGTSRSRRLRARRAFLRPKWTKSNRVSLDRKSVV